MKSWPKTLRIENSSAANKSKNKQFKCKLWVEKNETELKT